MLQYTVPLGGQRSLHRQDQEQGRRGRESDQRQDSRFSLNMVDMEEQIWYNFANAVFRGPLVGSSPRRMEEIIIKLKRMLCTCLALVLLLMLPGCGEKAKTPEEYIDLGVRYLESGDYDAAILQFTALLEIDPKSVDALTGRAQALRALGGEENLASARTDYEAAMEINNSDLQIWLGLADTLMDLDSMDEAADLLAEAYATFGESSDLSERIDRLIAVSHLEGDDLIRFGRKPPVATRIADFGPGTLTQEDQDEISGLLDELFGSSFLYFTSETACDLSADNAQTQAMLFTLYPLTPLYSHYFGYDDIILQEGENFAPDPLGYFPLPVPGYYISYISAPADRVDWILQNVLNVEPVHPDSPVFLRELTDPTEAQYYQYYYYNGRYYCMQPPPYGDQWDTPEHSYTETVQSGDFYYTLVNSDYYNTDYTPEGTHAQQWALLKKNNVDGQTVWSLCYYGIDPLDDVSRFTLRDEG